MKEMWIFTVITFNFPLIYGPYPDYDTAVEQAKVVCRDVNLDPFINDDDPLIVLGVSKTKNTPVQLHLRKLLVPK
jgi:hypothetical protein